MRSTKLTFSIYALEQVIGVSVDAELHEAPPQLKMFHVLRFGQRLSHRSSHVIVAICAIQWRVSVVDDSTATLQGVGVSSSECTFDDNGGGSIVIIFQRFGYCFRLLDLPHTFHHESG